VCATSANATSAPAPPIHSASTAAIGAIRSAVLPDKTNVVITGSGWATTDSVTGACSTTIWALVPLTPNEDTPARRGRSTAGHAMPWAAIVNRDAPATALGVNEEKFRCAGT
jgi:hypothetical protein